MIVNQLIKQTKLVMKDDIMFKAFFSKVGSEKYLKDFLSAILDYDLTPLPEYITKTIRVDNKYRQYELNNIVTYYYIELKKFREQNPDMNEPINQWLAFIDMERRDLLEMAKENSKIIKEAYGEYEVLTGEDEVKRLEEIRLMSHLEEQSALSWERKQGLKQGKEEGLKQLKEEKIKIVKKLLKSKMSIEQISEITELSREDIEKIMNGENI